MSALLVKLVIWGCLAFAGVLATLDLIEGRGTARVILACMFLSIATIATLWWL